MNYTEELKFRIKDDSPLYTAMYIHEVFTYFEEIRCIPLLGRRPEFYIHKDDIKPNGKFEKFSNYSIKKFSKEFWCSVWLG